MSLPRLIVVSLHKAGTHLALRLVEELGYQRRFFDDPMLESVRRDPPEQFLATFEPGAAYFLHECRADRIPRPLLDHWREQWDPTFIYQYRDPRAVLLSQVNYLRGSHRRGTFSNTPYHLVFSDALKAQPTERDALDVAIRGMGEYLEESFLGSVWMRYHPKVLQLRFEHLAGGRGGGSDAEQLEEVERALRHLGQAGDAKQIASRLYDPSQPTFHRGTIDAWRDVYTPEQLELFERRYGHILDAYAYPRARDLPPARR